ncbi:MAG: DUF72 domain-containing protein, partial [Candidatus Aminicenantales bacterium]
SGWSYQGWRERFYPPELPQREWLEYFARHFNTVEINMTFYRFPKPEMLQGWRARTPEGFAFTLKANRLITHRKKLKDVQGDVRYFDILAENLKEKLGCILYQLPPSLACDHKLLEDFLQTLPPSRKNVIEFRNETWYNDKTYDLLRRHGVTFCTVSSTRVPATVVETSGTAYFRFHGLVGGYRYRYSDEELEHWARVIASTSADEAYVYFNNDYNAYAVENCRTLARTLRAIRE